MSASRETIPLPKPFHRAVSDMLTHRWRSQLKVEEMPAPQRIAPFACAITADIASDGDEEGTGRLILLHDPAGNEAWSGTFRLVTFARADIDAEMVTDPLLLQVGWTWLTDALDGRNADYLVPSGTATAVSSQSFGGMEDDPARAEIEIRASWSPELDPSGAGLEPHLEAWADLLCTAAGVPPLPAGVVAMPSRRSRSF